MSTNASDKNPHSIRCADCMQCRQVKEQRSSGRYILLARCAAGHWVKAGKHYTVDIHRIHTKWVKGCPDYLSSSDDDDDREGFLASLPESLPPERIVYEPDGAVADFTEVDQWDDAR